MTWRMSALNTGRRAGGGAMRLRTFSNDWIPQLRKKSISWKKIFQMNGNYLSKMGLIAGGDEPVI